MSTKIRVVISGEEVEGCSLLAVVLQSRDDIAVVGVTNDWRQLSALLRTESPQVVLLDTDTASEGTVTVLKTARLKRMPVAFLGLVGDAEANRGLLGQLDAVVLKSDPIEEMLDTLTAIAVRDEPPAKPQAACPVPPPEPRPKVAPRPIDNPEWLNRVLDSRRAIEDRLVSGPPVVRQTREPSPPAAEPWEPPVQPTAEPAPYRPEPIEVPQAPPQPMPPAYPARPAASAPQDWTAASAEVRTPAVPPPAPRQEAPAQAPQPPRPSNPAPIATAGGASQDMGRAGASTVAPLNTILRPSPVPEPARPAPEAARPVPEIASPVAPQAAPRPSATPAMEAVETAADPTVREFLPPTGTTNLVVSPFGSFRSLGVFQQAMERLDGVKSARLRRFHQGTLYLIVRYDGTTPLEQRVTELTQFGPQVVSSKPGLLELRVNSEDKDALRASSRE